MKNPPMSSKDDYNILEFVERKNNNNYFRAVCSKCGHTKNIGENNLKKQSLFCNFSNCREDYLRTLIGTKMGDYKIIDVQNEMIVAECTICGHKKYLRSHELKWRSYNHGGLCCGEDYVQYFIGKIFGDYTVTGIDTGNQRVSKEIYYVAKCGVCGTEITAPLKVLNKLPKHGDTCFKALPNSEYKTVLEQRFNDMKQRCYNPNNTNYHHYGARGIKVEYEYLIDFYMDFIDEFKEFAATNGIRNTTFDRIDVNGNYCKGNIRLATQSVQSTNTTRRRLFIIQKDSERVIGDNAMEVARRYGINGRSLGNVIRGSSKSASGWTLVGTYPDDVDIQQLINDKDVTTNLIMSK